MNSHRAAWIVAHGPIKGGLCVLHHCDNPACCNPAHLYLGTKGDNARDKVIRFRHARGEKHHNAKLTIAGVAEIRSSVGRLTIDDLAVKLGVSRSLVHAVRKHKIWKHIA